MILHADYLLNETLPKDALRILENCLRYSGNADATLDFLTNLEGKCHRYASECENSLGGLIQPPPFLFMNRCEEFDQNLRRLASNDIQYFGCTEKRDRRCHTHTLIHIKRRALTSASALRETIQRHLPCGIVTIPEASTRELANQIVTDPVNCAAYITKRNRNDMEIQANHFSKDFINFVENYRKHGG